MCIMSETGEIYTYCKSYTCKKGSVMRNSEMYQWKFESITHVTVKTLFSIFLYYFLIILFFSSFSVIKEK